MTVSIHRYAATADKFFVNSFIIESDQGLVLIDTQFLLSSAQDIAAQILAIGKKLHAIIITHPHPDHFNGLPVILEKFGPVPVYANQPTIDEIVASRAEKRAVWTPVYGSDYPPTDATPDHILAPDETITLAGVEVRLLDLGPGESADNSIIHIPQADALIVSDLVYNQCHPWLAEHRVDQWLAQLDRVIAEFGFVKTIFPGHGPEGGSELLSLQRDYIVSFRDAIAANTRDGVLDLSAVAAATRQNRTGWPLEMLIEMNASAIAA